MHRIDHGPLTYFQFELLSQFEDLVHGVFGRHGGVSGPPFTSLNVSYAVADLSESVRENRKILCAALSIPYQRLVVAKQVHGIDVVVVDETADPSDPDDWYRLLPSADAIITGRPGHYPMMTFADCVPLVFFDPKTRGLGIAHGGWKGTAAHVARHTVEAMIGTFGSRPEDLLVGIGPSIGPCCYEIKEDVASRVRESVRSTDGILLDLADGTIHLDLWEMNRRQLREAGVSPDCIELAGLCTACHTETFFSNRAERGSTGRFGAVIGRRP